VLLSVGYTRTSVTVFAGEEVSIDSFVMESLSPSNVKDFFRYDGSYTTPDCKEVVIWTVLKEPISITSEQVDLSLAIAWSSHSCAFFCWNDLPVSHLWPTAVQIDSEICNTHTAVTLQRSRFQYNEIITTDTFLRANLLTWLYSVPKYCIYRT